MFGFYLYVVLIPTELINYIFNNFELSYYILTSSLNWELQYYN